MLLDFYMAGLTLYLFGAGVWVHRYMPWKGWWNFIWNDWPVVAVDALIWPLILVLLGIRWHTRRHR